MSMTLEQFGIDRLGTGEKVELISLIWDSLPNDEPWVPPDWQLIVEGEEFHGHQDHPVEPPGNGFEKDAN